MELFSPRGVGALPGGEGVPSLLECADCGRPMIRVQGSLPAGLARCHPCRRLRPTGAKTATCVWCRGDFAYVGPRLRRFCSKTCANRAHAPAFTRSPTDSRVTRGAREAAAPGIPRSQRNRLLRMWKRQGRSCAYCPAPATTVDHVVPLILGGTNFEGNLAPACRACNSSKSGLLLAEWRLKGRARLRVVA